ncbi:MAG: regulatory protein RecX [Blastocatellia bacterium]
MNAARADEERGDEAKPRRAVDPERIRERIFQRALNVLAARPRSEAQLRERLLAKEWATVELVDQCIARLKELGYVNDATFAESYANYRMAARPVGRQRLARELAQKRVARQTIDRALDEAFEETSEETLIERALAKRLRAHGRPTDRQSAKRLFDHLMRLGFGYDLIVRKLRELQAEVEENDE